MPTKWQDKIRLKRMTKEAFDNLPSGICYFDDNGVVTLCNRQMHHLYFSLTGSDLQSIDELQILLKGNPKFGRRENDIFLLEDGSAWRFSAESITTELGRAYTQVVASNVTELYYNRIDLERNNLELKDVGKRLRRLSANIIDVTREEEILNMKMRVHDDIGRSVIATRRLLQQHRPSDEIDLTTWKNAVSLLQHNSQDHEEKNALTQLIEAAAGIGIKIILDGQLPKNESAAYLLITAMRECATNAVRHAGGSELYVKLIYENGFAKAIITNNGDMPISKITEGGGLSSLRAHLEKAGGLMSVRNMPAFELTAAVPLAKEEMP